MYFSIYAETNGEVSLIDEAGEYNPAYAVKDPAVKQEANKSGSLEFTIHPLHPYFNRFIKMKTKMWVIQDGICIFYGRVLYTQMDMSGSKKVYCEGALSYLLDTLASKERALIVQRALASDQIDPDWHIDVRDFTKFDLTVADFYKLLIALHNTQVSGTESQDKRFSIDPSQIGFIGNSEKYNFEIEGMTNMADFILDNLVDQVGGYITVRPVFSGTNLQALYIDWNKIPDSVENFQTVEFGKNLIKFSSDENGSELFTIFVPTGKPTDSSKKDVHLYDIENWDNPEVLSRHPKHFYFNKRTANNHESIYTEPTGDPDEVEVNIDANPNTNYLTNEIQIITGINKYGKIYKAYDIENVNAGDALYNLAIDKVIKLYDPEPAQLTVTALDLYKLGYADQSPIRFGAYLTVKSGPHGLDRKMLCCQVDHKLRDPQNTTYTLTSDLNEKGDGVPIFSKDTSKARGGGGGGSGGSSSGGTLSGKTSEEEKKTKNMILTLGKTVTGLGLEFYKTENEFRILAETIGFGVNDDGSGSSAELELLKRTDAETGEVIAGISMNVNQHGKEIGKLELLKDHFGVVFSYDEDGNAETITDSTVMSELNMNQSMIEMVVNPPDGLTPASIKIGAIADGLNTTSGVAINAEVIQLGPNKMLSEKAGVLDELSVGNNSTVSIGTSTYISGSAGISGDLEVGWPEGGFTVTHSGDIQGESITVGSATINGNDVNVYDVQINGNSLTIYYVDGTDQTFSKAITSWTTEWDNGAIVMTASPQNQSNSYTPYVGLFGNTQYDHFTADIFDPGTSGGPPVSRKQANGYLIETVNGSNSYVDVSPNSNGSSPVARISTAATYSAGVTAGNTAGGTDAGVTKGTWSGGVLQVNRTANTITKTATIQLSGGTPSWNGSTVSIPILDGSGPTYYTATATAALQSKTASTNGTVTPDSGYIGLSSVTVSVSGSNYTESDVVVSLGSIGTPTLNTSTNHWYSDIDVTKKLPATSSGTTSTYAIDVQPAVNVGVSSGWSQCYATVDAYASSTTINPGTSVRVYARAKDNPDAQSVSNADSVLITANSGMANSMTISRAAYNVQKGTQYYDTRFYRRNADGSINTSAYISVSAGGCVYTSSTNVGSGGKTVYYN